MPLPVSPERTHHARKWLLWSLAILIVVIGIATLAIEHALHDETRWIALLEQRASQASGRDVHIAGLALQLWPVPGAQATGLTVANPAWTRDPYLIQADSVSARFAFWPLLRGKLQLTSLAATGIALDLETSADGGHSWIRTTPAAANHTSAQLDLGQLTAISLHQLDARYRAPGRPSDAPHWLLDHLDVRANAGLRDIGLDALLRHGSRTLEATGRFDQLAALAHGEITLHSGATHMRLVGQLPLRGALHGADFSLRGDAERLDDTLAFFDIVSRPIAPLHLAATVREHDGRLLATELDARLAALQVRGAVQLDLRSDKPVLDGQLRMARLDWVQTLLDAGRPPLPPKLPGELFRTHRLAWRVLNALHGWRGTVELDIGVLKTRPGIELTDGHARLHFEDDVLHVAPMQAGMLGGRADGTLHLTGHNQHAHLELQLHDVSLPQWIVATHHKAPLTGGSMQVVARVDANGATMKQLAASMSGPVSIRLGPTDITTKGGARAEELLTGLMPIFSARNSGHIALECAAANLQFSNGRAAASPLVGARSQASQLLTSGFVDLREQTLDLRGRVRARSGFSLGLSTLAGDVKITGLLTHPQARLDPAGTPAALARLGAAFVTAGLSIVATALWDGANPGTDPCQAVFLPHVDGAPASAHLGQKALP